jgi:trk system potassium uptake protein TrkA
MKIVLSEGNSQADFLVGLFKNKRCQLIVINSNKRTCEFINHHANVPVYYGDPTKKYVLEEANIQNADIFISLSENDEINYVSCQLAKRIFNVKKTICSVRNPKDVTIFERLGIDSALSSTYLVAKVIEKESLSNDIYQLLNIDSDDVTLTKIKLPEGHSFENKRLMDIKMPLNIIISCVLRNHEIIIPNGQTTLYENDILYVVTKSESLEGLNELFQSKEVKKI